jgi:hypothetical protein
MSKGGIKLWEAYFVVAGASFIVDCAHVIWREKREFDKDFAILFGIDALAWPITLPMALTNKQWDLIVVHDEALVMLGTDCDKLKVKEHT